MKLLLDQGLPRSAARLLREEGVDAVHVEEIGCSTAVDAKILVKGGITARRNRCFHPIVEEPDGRCQGARSALYPLQGIPTAFLAGILTASTGRRRPGPPWAVSLDPTTERPNTRIAGKRGRVMIGFQEQYLVDEEGTRKAVVVPISIWEQIVEALEEFEDIRAYDEAKREPSEPVPFEQAVSEIARGISD